MMQRMMMMGGERVVGSCSCHYHPPRDRLRTATFLPWKPLSWCFEAVNWSRGCAVLSVFLFRVCSPPHRTCKSNLSLWKGKRRQWY